MTTEIETRAEKVAYADPVHSKYPIDTPEHAKAAWSYINQEKNASQYSSGELRAIKDRIMAACEKFGIKIAEEENGEGEPSSAPEERAQTGDIEERAAVNLDNVDFAERIISVIAVPYESPTIIEHRGQQYTEVFSRSAFNGLRVDAPRARTIPVTAVLTAPAFTHEGGHLVGRVFRAEPNHAEGLRLDLKISKGKEGDDTLNFTDDGVLHPSVGFAPGVRPGDVQMDRQTRTRRINRAFLDHLAFVPTPAYQGAKVLAVRAAGAPDRAVSLAPTPFLDAMSADPVLRWADERLRNR